VVDRPEQANVGMAHRCRQAKHATWTAAVVDMAMGAVAGVLVVRHQSWITHFVQRMVRMLTNDILRTGCIWLMGVPAGFKLNDELAARLGTLSLHVIQTWATVGVLVRPALRICLPVLGLLAMLLGITVPAAILVDTILLGTIHIAILHQATASLYANQLRALAALWRLFRFVSGADSFCSLSECYELLGFHRLRNWQISAGVVFFNGILRYGN